MDISESLRANRQAVDEFIQSADNSAAVWTDARAPGKWSPSQVAEHVARTLEESANMLGGRPSKLPTFPGLLRPILRVVLMKRVLNSGRFPRARTNPAMNPAAGPASTVEARQRLLNACDVFENECRLQAQKSERSSTGLFGEVAITDFVRFTELHTRHHNLQLPGCKSVSPAGRK